MVNAINHRDVIVTDGQTKIGAIKINQLPEHPVE